MQNKITRFLFHGSSKIRVCAPRVTITDWAIGYNRSNDGKLTGT